MTGGGIPVKFPLPNLTRVCGWLKTAPRVALVAAVFCVLGASPAYAWKPNTHIYAANQAAASIYAGTGKVEINGKLYNVDLRVAEAIQNFPSYYRAGTVGPDAYPDIYVGQAFIHPDTRNDNGELPDGGGHQESGHSFTYEWLRHVYQAGWKEYTDRGGDAEGQKVLAFTYGYLNHAAGDMWAHTFVNDFAQGIFPAWTDFEKLPIGVRHLIVEAYIGEFTPPTDLGMEAPLDFVYTTLIAGGKPGEGGFVDDANHDPGSLGRGVVLEFFWDLYHGLDERNEALKGLGPLHPLYLLAQPLIAYIDAWEEDIIIGLKQWPGMSHQVALALFIDSDFGAAGDAIGDWIIDYGLSMIGLPDVVGELLGFISDILSLFDPIIEPIGEALEELRNTLVKQLFGIDIEELKEYFLSPETYINSSLLGLPSDTSAKIDALMGLNGGQYHSDTAFAAMKNTITTCKLILLSADGLNQLLYDNRVGPLYSHYAPFSDRANFMLGWIRTIDGHEQWRKGSSRSYSNAPPGTRLSEGMPMWVDCLARERLFRSLFTDWQHGSQQFPALGEDPEDISATPPPTSSLAVIGPHVAVGSKVYVGATTKFKVSATPDHFWNADEINVEGAILPNSPTVGTPEITLGPIQGADGEYTVRYNANGFCLDGPPHGETPKEQKFTLDQTPPAITVVSPTQGQVLDVNQMATASFSAVDAGSGLASLTATLDGVPIANGATIDAFLLNAGDHHLVVKATDKVGNTATVDRKFEVHATIAGLKAAISRARAEKLITLPPNDNSLQNQLDAAQAALDRGNVASAKNKLESVAGLVEGQIGVGIDAAFANRFIGWVNDLVARL
jgi:hypothetical protein